MKRKSPYSGLDARQFWTTGVEERSPVDPQDFYRKKFALEPETRIATAGSCFAQHISQRLFAAGYAVMDVEPAPAGLPTVLHRRFGYATYSARYGNIYTARQLLQLAREAFGDEECPDVAWEKGGRWYDSNRPGVEPDGLPSVDLVKIHRRHHLGQVRRLFKQMDVLIFTLGLTEAWRDRATGWVFPTAPATVCGEYLPDEYEFVNFTHADVLADLKEFCALVRRENGGRELKMILTVSPVPLAATYEIQHVLTATTYSKSVLRAVAGELSMKSLCVDYFPSFEIISNPWTRGVFYARNGRDVEAIGVDAVMGQFFSAHPPVADGNAPAAFGRGGRSAPVVMSADDLACEERLLDQFRGEA